MKVHLCRTLIMSVLLYSTETWTLLVANLQKIESFYMKCLRQLLCQLAGPGQQRVGAVEDWSDDNHQFTIFSHRLFVHVARLDARVPAHTALRLMTNVHSDGKKTDE